MAYLVYGANGALLNGYRYDNLPVLLSRRHRSIRIYNRYCRYLARTRNVRFSTGNETLKTLVNFASFLERQEIRAILSQKRRPLGGYRRACRDVESLLANVDDSLLETYRDNDEENGISPKVINRKLGRILHFFVWAQKYGYYTDVIGVVENGEKYPINIWWEARSNSKKKALCSELLFRGRSLSQRLSGVPTDAEMGEAYIAVSLADIGVATRDALLLRLAEDLALRGAECLGLKCEDLPTRKQLATDEVQEEGWLITVERKGGSLQDVMFDADTLGELRNYVDDIRSEVMERHPNTPEHGFIFVSHSTGERPNRQYISRRLSKAFDVPKSRRRGQKQKLSHQRVRAKRLTEIVRTLVDEDIKTEGSLRNIKEEHILTIAAQFAGHKNKESLRPYLDLEIARRIGTPRRRSGNKKQVE